MAAIVIVETESNDQKPSKTLVFTGSKESLSHEASVGHILNLQAHSGKSGMRENGLVFGYWSGSV
jgi:hypothetical protein